jgi:hypothetical protein
MLGHIGHTQFPHPDKFIPERFVSSVIHRHFSLLKYYCTYQIQNSERNSIMPCDVNPVLQPVYRSLSLSLSLSLYFSLEINHIDSYISFEKYLFHASNLRSLLSGMYFRCSCAIKKTTFKPVNDLDGWGVMRIGRILNRGESLLLDSGHVRWNLILFCAWNYRHSFRENKPKTLVFYDWIRAFWACFHENAGL